MFGLSAAVRVYLAKEPADMRKSFDGLAALASVPSASTPFPGISSSSSTSVGIASRSCIGTAMAWRFGPSGSNAGPTASRPPRPPASR